MNATDLDHKIDGDRLHLKTSKIYTYLWENKKRSWNLQIFWNLTT